MLDFIKNKRNKYNIREEDLDNFLLILNNILNILNNAEHNAQSGFINKLINLVIQKETSLFIELVNGIEMWGGAGAVWEVCIDNKEDAKSFKKEILNLINLMDDTNILGKGIKPIRRLFEKDLKSFNS